MMNYLNVYERPGNPGYTHEGKERKVNVSSVQQPFPCNFFLTITRWTFEAD